MLRKVGTLRGRWPKGSLILAVSLGVILFLVAPSPAGTPSAAQSSLKDKRPTAPQGRSFHTPRSGAVSIAGQATRLGFCGGDDWEPGATGSCSHTATIRASTSVEAKRSWPGERA
jgi:hypothetical protein